VVRELRRQDAEAVARLAVAVNPHRIETAALVWQRASHAPRKSRRREWVAESGSEIVGHAYAGLLSSNPDRGRFWIAVHHEQRRRGLGSALYAAVEAHLLAVGSRRSSTWVDGDPAGERFVRERGYELERVDRVLELEVRAVDRPQLPTPEPGDLRLTPLTEALDQVEALFARCRSGELDLPADLREWKWDELEHPNLSGDGSFVMLDGAHPVALGLLTVDLQRGLAYNILTATLPGYRRRGLALLVKLASIEWAAANGIERIVTESDSENSGMLTLNERLGYRPLYDQGIWLR
jgi:GNAT superfamily N-acetyltransferase